MTLLTRQSVYDSGGDLIFAQRSAKEFMSLAFGVKINDSLPVGMGINPKLLVSEWDEQETIPESLKRMEKHIANWNVDSVGRTGFGMQFIGDDSRKGWVSPDYLELWLRNIANDPKFSTWDIVGHIQKHFNEELTGDILEIESTRNWLASAYNLLDILRFKVNMTPSCDLRLSRLRLHHRQFPDNSTPPPPEPWPEDE